MPLLSSDDATYSTTTGNTCIARDQEKNLKRKSTDSAPTMCRSLEFEDLLGLKVVFSVMVVHSTNIL